MRSRQTSPSSSRRSLTRAGLVLTAVAVSLALTAGGASASVGKGVTVGRFTLSQANWTPGTGGATLMPYMLTFQGDGNVVIYKYNADETAVTALWASGTNGKGVTQVDWSQSGYAKLENSSGTVLCTLGMLAPAPGGQAVMQTDGNLVFYDTSGTATWATGTSGGKQGDLHYCYS